MEKNFMTGKEIDSRFAERILSRLHAACLAATREIGDEMGFSIDEVIFTIEPLPDPVTNIDFSFNVTLRK